MTAADLLRRAAGKLRDTAAVTTFGTEGWAVDLKDSEVTTADGGMMIADTRELTDGRPDASYIALMHPPVALALADLLDRAADAITELEFLANTGRATEAHVAHLAGLLALRQIARAILREPEDGDRG